MSIFSIDDVTGIVLGLVDMAPRGALSPIAAGALDAIHDHSDMIAELVHALANGADKAALDLAIREALIAASDAEMAREFPGQS